MHSHWRDCKAWSDEGLGMQTTNNQTAKLFDVNLTQYISMQDLPEYGGIGKSMSAMVESDPHFVLGRVFKAATCFSSNSASYDHTDSFRNEVDLTLQLATQLETQLSERENLHVEALRHMKDGWKIRACEVYERILLKHPNDLMAHKLNQFFLFFLGKNQRMKAGTELVFKGCPPTNPLHHFLHGDMAFTHCENGLFSEAEILGRKGILLYPKDSWSYHAIAHCLEMTGRYEEGSQWLDTTMQEWQAGNLIACHVHWHNAVMKLHTGDSEAAVNILCQKILKEYLKPKDSLSFVDSSSLLYRLKLEGVSVDEAALEEFGSILEERLHDHLLTFNDVHCMLALLASKPLSQAHLFLRQLQHYVSTTDKHDSYRQVTSRVGIPLCRALLSKEEGDLEGAVHSLQAIMDDIRDIGGSDAQGLVMTAKSNFGGGNTHWEKQKLGRYEFSETRFLEVMEAVCSDSDKKCHSMLEELEETLERWWKKYYALQVKSDLKDFMCVRRLKVCCPRGTYGGKCTDCPGGKRTPCGNNGLCQGEGTKAGSGECVCEPGYEGDECERCASGYFQTLPPTPSFPSASTLHCSACHPSCKGACDGEGASACRACKEGWVWFDGVGCSDVDECEDETMCKGNQLCLNTQGGHQCKPCHKACASCTDLTHLHCISCAPAFYRDHFNACLPCHESCQMGCTDNSAFTCLQCKKGWKMSEQGCVDLDECEETGACQHDEYCINTVGSFKCSTCHPSCDGCHGSGSDKCMRCKMGYELKGGLCGDVNECLTNVCAGLNRRCINVPGSYFCECVVGFELDDTGACVPNPSVLSINGDDARSRRSSETHRNTDSDTKRSEEYKRKNTPKTTQKKKKKPSQITLHDSELFYYLLSLLLFALLAYLSTSLMPLQASLTAAFSIFLYHQSSRLDDLLKNSL